MGAGAASLAMMHHHESEQQPVKGASGRTFHKIPGCAWLKEYGSQVALKRKGHATVREEKRGGDERKGKEREGNGVAKGLGGRPCT
jgi:hypothetical protein